MDTIEILDDFWKSETPVVCPKCQHSEYLLYHEIVHLLTKRIVQRTLYCSNDFVDWNGCGWSGRITPSKTKV